LNSILLVLRFLTYEKGDEPMADDKLPMTVRGKALLEVELKRLLHEERPAIIKAIEEARAHGDISENAEYDAAKERQSLVEGRIAEIQGKLAGAEVIEPNTIKSDRIVFGATVKLMELESEEQISYQIVGIDEADVKQGRISIMSPIARALIGKKVGEIVHVKGAKSEKEYEIISFIFV
jgi:transcription elongation factor GreA